MKHGLLHNARHFVRAPTVPEALSLLSQISDSSCLFAPKPVRRPLVIYGAGTFGKLAKDVLIAAGISLDLVVDRAARELQESPDWAGMPLMTSDEVPNEVKYKAQLGVTVATSAFTPIEAHLRREGWRDIVPFYDIAETLRHKHPLSNGWFAAPLNAHSLAGTAETLRKWHDDASRAHHLQFLAWRLLREEWFFHSAPVTLNDRYFIPEIKTSLNQHERFVDGGAHKGETANAFMDIVKGSFDSIYAAEPDSESRCAFQERFHADLAEENAKITLASHALDASVGIRTFHSGLGFASQFSDTGRTVVQTRTIDSLCIAPTFIKLHLEGNELPALKGGLTTILRHRPIVAATTYHNEDGIYRTPIYLMQNLPDYRFFMRLHSWCGTGAVIYAVPAERLQ